MAAADAILFVEIENSMADDGRGPAVDHNDQLRIEPVGSDQHLIKPFTGVTVDVVNVIQSGKTKFIQVERINIGPDVNAGVSLSYDVPHRLGEAGCELFR